MLIKKQWVTVCCTIKLDTGSVLNPTFYHHNSAASNRLTEQEIMSTAVLVLVFLLGVNANFITFNYGGRANKLYVPNNYDPNKMEKGYPLFVMLHGCTQDPDTFAKGTKMV